MRVGKWPTTGARMISAMQRCISSATCVDNNYTHRTLNICQNNSKLSKHFHFTTTPHQHLSFPCISIQRWYSSNSTTELTYRDERVQEYIHYLLKKILKLQADVVSGKFKSDSDRQNVLTELANLKPIVAEIENYQKIEQELDELKTIGEGKKAIVQVFLRFTSRKRVQIVCV